MKWSELRSPVTFGMALYCISEATGIIRKHIGEIKKKRKWLSGLSASHARKERDNKTLTGKDKHTI